MSDEKSTFSNYIEEKPDFCHMRNANFVGHSYSQSSPHLDSSLQSDLNHLSQSYRPHLKSQPSSPCAPVDTSEDTKLVDVIKLPENLENLPKADDFPMKRSRWNTNEEILALLLNFSKHEDWQSKDVVIRPESGSMLMYSRKKVRYRRDGYCWKKRKDGKTTREDHMKLKVQGVECIYGCYVHSAVLPTFHRRCYWLLQNPDIVLVHYLNVPYPDDSKLAALIPNIAFWTEKKEWTREELLLQLKPMYESSIFENGKENEIGDSKLNRINQVSSFIESMIVQLLEKQRYVRTALANSLECGCGNRKCLGAARCARPIRRISSAKKQGKRTASINSKMQSKRVNNEKNVLKTTAVRKMSGINLETRVSTSQTLNSSSYYNNSVPISTTDVEQTKESQVQQNSQPLQLIQSSSQPDIQQQQQIQQSHEGHKPVMQTTNNKDILSNYTNSDTTTENYLPNVEFVNAEIRHYQSSYSSCPLVEHYIPNNDIEIANEKQEINVNDNASALLLYSGVSNDNDFANDKYQRDTPDGSDTNSYSTVHHQASPNNSFTSIEDADTYANGDMLDDLIMNVNPCYNYENGEYGNTDHSLYELIIQLTQKEKKTTCSNALMTCEKLQQYTLQNESEENYTSIFENNLPPVSDSNGNFINSCSRYSTALTTEDNTNHLHSMFGSDFSRTENNFLGNYPADVGINFTNTCNEFSTNERSTPNQTIQDNRQLDSPSVIIDFAPEWSYCEGGTKLLIIGPWYFQSEYAVLFDSYSVPATLIQTGVLKCYCPEHAVGLVSVQVTSAGSVISNSVVFEYKKRPTSDETVCHNLCNIKAEQYNQYMYENDTLLKFILIHRIEAIQDDAFRHSSSLVNKYETLSEKMSST